MFKKLTLAAAFFTSFSAVAAAPCTIQEASKIVSSLQVSFPLDVADACKNSSEKELDFCQKEVAADYLASYIQYSDMSVKPLKAEMAELIKDRDDRFTGGYSRGLMSMVDVAIDTKNCSITSISAYDAIKNFAELYNNTYEKSK